MMTGPDQILGTQYYRPPFPERGHWEQDLKEIRAAGLNTVQLWVVWAWVESKSGTYNFADYDELIDIADRHGLGIVLSTVAAIHPYWIHREVPDSEMITNQGLKVISTNRRECHFGLTPGGCFDHPGVWTRMEQFLTATVNHFRSRTNLVAWDIWNELRWNVHADGLVCYCDHTIAEYHRWLASRYGNLKRLNAAWKRRYHRWEDVQPGKRAGRTYTEMMSFQHFITQRSVEHGRRRFEIVKGIDPDRPVTLHGGKPTVLYGDDAYDSEDQPSTVLHRGNDWGFAEFSDAIGCSSFPTWEEIDLFDFTARLDFVRSASPPGRGIWLSELQGGMSAMGFTAQHPVTAAEQQRWIWTGMANGADTILFWCWRDEVFGKESGGFGLAGRDGNAADRIAALRKTRSILDREKSLVTAVTPAAPEVGIWFSPQSYYLYWCQLNSADIPMQGIQGVARALIGRSIPYRVVEETNPEGLDGIGLLFLPRCNVLDREQEAALQRFVREGGVLVVESEFGAYDSAGLYYESDERFLSRLAGIADIGRRPLESPSMEVDLSPIGGASGSAGPAGPVAPAGPFRVPATQWMTPFGDGSSSAIVRVGDGAVVALGSYVFDAYYRGEAGADGCEALMDALLVRAGIAAPVIVQIPHRPTRERPLVHGRMGRAAGKTVLACFCEDPDRPLQVETTAAPGGTQFRDIISGSTYTTTAGGTGGAEMTLNASDWGVHWLVEE